MMNAKVLFFVVVLSAGLYLASKSLFTERMTARFTDVSPWGNRVEKNVSQDSHNSQDLKFMLTQVEAKLEILNTDNQALKQDIESLKTSLAVLRKTKAYKPSNSDSQDAVYGEQPSLAKLSHELKENSHKLTENSHKLTENSALTATDALKTNTETKIEDGSNTIVAPEASAITVNNNTDEDDRAKRLQQLAQLRDLSTKRQLAAISIVSQ
ncbi:hypothetical protein [Agaribacter flavus]|uniref:Uncharacterized protein n=1 Tax=Agaribacter flavus TaxID=1902781 RepID=A0ABV7FQF8_9ALTE